MVFGLLVFSVVSLSSVAARAASAIELQQEALIREGIELRRQGHDERALPIFQKAYDLLDSPRSAGQLGLCEMAVGYWIEAEQHLSEALQTPDHPWVAKNLETLQKERARVLGNIGELAIDGAPAGAQVVVNHRPAGTLPLAAPVRVAKGRVEVEVSAPGYTTLTQSRSVAGGDRQRLTVNLERVSVATAPGEGAKQPPPAASSPPVAAVPTARAPASPSTDESSAPRSRIGWGLGIGTGVALAGAVVETIVWQKHRSDFNSNGACDAQSATRGGAGCDSLYNSIHTAETVAIIGYAVAAALGVGSAVVLLTGKTSEPTGTGTHLACAPSLGSTFVSCALRF